MLDHLVGVLLPELRHLLRDISVYLSVEAFAVEDLQLALLLRLQPQTEDPEHLRIRDVVDLPIAAYHVSGEYAMIKAGAEKGWVDEKAIVLETLMCFRRAGADVILTYYATDAAQWMNDEGNVCL